MIRRYPLSEEGKRQRLRQMRNRGYLLAASMVVVIVPIVLRDIGPEGVTVINLLPFLFTGIVAILVIINLQRKGLSIVESTAIVLSEEGVAEMRGNVTALAVQRDRIAAIEADASGKLFVMAEGGATAMTLRPEVVDFDDLRLRLSHEYGIRPRTVSHRRRNGIAILRAILLGVAALVTFIVDVPGIFGAALAVYTVLFVWSMIEMKRLYDTSRSQLVVATWGGGFIIIIGIVRLAALLRWI